MRLASLVVLGGGLAVASLSWAAASAVTSPPRLILGGGIFPDPDLLDGSKEKAEERQDYGMLGEFDVPAGSQQASDQKDAAQKGQGGQSQNQQASNQSSNQSNGQQGGQQSGGQSGGQDGSQSGGGAGGESG